MTSEEALKAERIVGDWFWQPDSWHRKSVVRYYESAPIQPDVLQLVIAYLKQQETDELCVLNKRIPLGETWKAHDAWFQTTPADKWAGTESTKVRIYQSFSPKADETDGPYTVENGCKYALTHEFHWDVAAVPELPASSSGVSYTLQGVTRDRETGLYSCVIERRETVQQDVAKYGTGETAFESRSEEQHLGVKQQSVAATGKAASVSAGTIVRRRVTKNPDCTSDVHNETIVEKKVAGAVVDFRKTLRATVTTKTDRSQSAPLSAEGMAVGESRHSELTEGKLWNNTVTQYQKTAAGTIGEECARGDLEHRHTTSRNVANQPSVERQEPAVNVSLSAVARRNEDNTWDVSTTEIVYRPKSTPTLVAGSPEVRTESTVGINQPEIPTVGVGGVNEHTRVSASPNDHGSYSTTVERIVYSPSRLNLVSGNSSASVELEIGKNQPSVSGGVGGVNQDVSISASKNDHGSYDYQKRTINYSSSQKTLTAGNRAASVTLVIGKNQPSVSGGVGGVNQDVSISASKNDHGSYDYQRRTVNYAKRTVTARSSFKTEEVEVTTAINDTSPAIVSDGEASAQPNDHGSATTRIVKITPRPLDTQWIPWQSKVKSPTSTLTYDHCLRLFKNQQTPPNPKSGYEASINVSINKFGLYDGSIHCSRLESWTKNDSGSGGGGGGGGGQAYGPVYVFNGKRYHSVYRTQTFYGKGNEGSIASAMANASKVSSANGVACIWTYLKEEEV